MQNHSRLNTFNEAYLTEYCLPDNSNSFIHSNDNRRVWITTKKYVHMQLRDFMKYNNYTEGNILVILDISLIQKSINRLIYMFIQSLENTPSVDIDKLNSVVIQINNSILSASISSIMCLSHDGSIDRQERMIEDIVDEICGHLHNYNLFPNDPVSCDSTKYRIMNLFTASVNLMSQEISRKVILAKNRLVLIKDFVYLSSHEVILICNFQ